MGIQKAYNGFMKPFRWDPRKDELLKSNRGVSFEQVRDEIVEGRFKIVRNASLVHDEQRAYLVRLNDYVHVVPFREDEDSILLITIFPSRVWDKKFRGAL
jgi:uncharacterized DUF497 family protein